MVTLVVAMLFQSSVAKQQSTEALVARMADLKELSLSAVASSSAESTWPMFDIKIATMPWARDTLKRPDLIAGWLNAFRDSPLPSGGEQFGSRFGNLLGLLSYPPFIVKERGKEEEILRALTSRCSEAQLPEGPCVRFARVLFPKSKMAHLYDGLLVQADGAGLGFYSEQSERLYDRNAPVAKHQLVQLMTRIK